MNIFSRIAIGTANWGKEYNGVKVPEKDIEKILGMAQCSGIDTLDCATAYGWDFNQANSYFNKIIKIQSLDEIEKVLEDEPSCIMAHKPEIYREMVLKLKVQAEVGISIYSINEMPSGLPNIIQIPYSLYDRRFEQYFSDWKIYGNRTSIHARSIFLRGRIIQDGIPAEECLKFVLANPYIDKIIIGADSFDQFRRNLDFIHRWNNKEKHDENLLDPRRWEKE